MDFKEIANKVTGKATELAENVAQYVDDRRTFCRMTSALTAAKEGLEFLFAEYGRLAYHGSAALAGVRSKEEICADIQATITTIAEIEAALEEFLKPDEPEMPGATEEEPAALYCHKCGKPQSSDNDFCPKCGAQLTK